MRIRDPGPMRQETREEVVEFWRSAGAGDLRVTPPSEEEKEFHRERHHRLKYAVAMAIAELKKEKVIRGRAITFEVETQ